MSKQTTPYGDERPPILLIAGFGDNASMFKELANTQLAASYRLIPFNLPGFDAPPLEEAATLEALAQTVAEAAIKSGAEIIVAHSVASIIASLAAKRADCPLTTIVSLEGNITADDAYFSGTAARFDDPASFRAHFLGRLDDMSKSDPIIQRYRDEVLKADITSLWQLGTDAHHFSATHVPGEVLQKAARVIYFYNPDNCPDSTVRWLEESAMKRVVLSNASHWASIDQPETLAAQIAKAL